MCQKLRICGTFWYFRHLWPSDLLGVSWGLFVTWIHWKFIPSDSQAAWQAWEWSMPLLGDLRNHFRCLRVFGSVLGYIWGVKASKGILRGSVLVHFLQFSSIVSNHKWAYWHFPVDLEVPNAWNIKMSHTHATFGRLGSLGRGFSAELEEFTFWQFQMIILYDERLF